MGRKLVGAVAAAVLIAGCGSSGSSKPSYCSSLTSLEDSIKAVPSTDIIQNGTKGLKASVDNVVNNAHAVVDSAKKDFPNETGAITSSIDSLTTTINEIEKSPTPALVVQAAGGVAALGTAVKNFSSSASSQCG
ncbi:MAG: hypothetical protein ACJ780_01775 [Solirubrobacteraceae bacterium]